MSITVSIVEHATSGGEASEVSLEFLEENLSLRELIRRYIYERVSERNAHILGGARPPASEPGHSWRFAGARKEQLIDWEAEYQRALAGFQARGYLVLVDDCQVGDLDQQVQLRVGSLVTFLRLVPLAGG